MHWFTEKLADAHPGWEQLTASGKAYGRLHPLYGNGTTSCVNGPWRDPQLLFPRWSRTQAQKTRTRRAWALRVAPERNGWVGVTVESILRADAQTRLVLPHRHLKRREAVIFHAMCIAFISSTRSPNDPPSIVHLHNQFT